jgi:hypothetical protein
MVLYKYSQEFIPVWGATRALLLSTNTRFHRRTIISTLRRKDGFVAG